MVHANAMGYKNDDDETPDVAFGRDAATFLGEYDDGDGEGVDLE